MLFCFVLVCSVPLSIIYPESGSLVHMGLWTEAEPTILVRQPTGLLVEAKTSLPFQARLPVAQRLGFHALPVRDGTSWNLTGAGGHATRQRRQHGTSAG